MLKNKIWNEPANIGYKKIYKETTKSADLDLLRIKILEIVFYSPIKNIKETINVDLYKL
jgi:hypothetical protein